MKSLPRIIITAIIIWMLGVSMYSLSFYIPVMENQALQANLLLMLAVIPLVWLGARTYYHKYRNPKGLVLGLAFFIIAGCLDALITVPYFILPSGGSYTAFFTDLGFWLIGLEFILIPIVYRNLYIKNQLINHEN